MESSIESFLLTQSYSHINQIKVGEDVVDPTCKENRFCTMAVNIPTATIQKNREHFLDKINKM